MIEQQINEAVARKLGTLPECNCMDALHKAEATHFIKPYSTSLEAAWEIVKHLCKIGHPPTIWVYDERTACISFTYDEMVTDILPVPMAICMAFLALP